MPPHTRLRAYRQCPLCGHDKPLSALCCWPCFGKHHVAAGDNSWAEARFDRVEAALETAELFTAQFPAIAASQTDGV